MLKTSAAACRAGHGFNLPQAKLAVNLAQQLDVLADGGLCRVEHPAEMAQRKDVIGRRGQNPRHRADALVSFDLIHGIPLANPECSEH